MMKRMFVAVLGAFALSIAGCSDRGEERGRTSAVSPTVSTVPATATVPGPPTPTQIPTIARGESGKQVTVRWRWDSGLFDVVIWVRASGSKVAASYGGLYQGPGNFDPRPGGVALLDAATGTQLWRHDTPTQAFPAAFAGGVVAAGTGDGTVLAWDEVTGAERWRLPFDGIPFQVAQAAGVLVVADADPETWGPNGLVDKTRLGGRVWGIDPASGTVIWKATVGSFNAFFAVESLLMGGFVAVSSSSPSGGGDTVIIEPRTGKERWRKPLEASSPPAVEGSLLVVPGASLQAFDLTTGDPRWSATVPEGGTSFFPGITANAVIAGTNTGSLSVLDARNGNLLAVSRFGECVSRATEWFSGLASGSGLLCGSLVRLNRDTAGWKLVTILTPQGAIDSAAGAGSGIVLSTGIGSAPEQVLFIEP